MTGKFPLRTWRFAVLALAAAATLAPRPARAQSQGQQPGPYFVLRAYYLADKFPSHSGESRLGVDSFTTVTYDGKPGGGFDFEFLPIVWLGIDFAASQTHIQGDEVTRTPVGAVFETKGNIQVRPFTVGVFAHPFYWEHLDLYLGPYIGVVNMTGSFRPAETRFGFGSALGLDFRLGSSGLAVSAVGRILSNRFSDQLRNASHYRNNYLFGGGLSYRW
jgi:hypothetical protein